ncbi:MAG: diaminopimelate dehydrogenase [Bacteroidales bacterium]
MKKIRAAIVGYGNIGHYVLDALEEAQDFEISGIVRRNANDVPERLKPYKIVTSLAQLEGTDVAILCAPSRLVEKYATEALENGINCVDSFDIHTQVPAYRKRIGEIAKAHGKVAVISAGWDPGTDSMVRGILKLCAPKGVTYTNFGPGMSMGHTVAVKAIEGVKKALSMTIPVGTGIHRRMVYVELQDGYKIDDVAARIKADSYFAKDETHVTEVDCVDNLLDMGHGVNLVRKGVSGKTQNQRFEFDMTINNPALTGEILVSTARASMLQKPGSYTMIEIPIIDYLFGDREKLVGELV